MNGFEGRDGFHFDNNGVFHHGIEAIAGIEHNPFVNQGQCLLSDEPELAG